MKKYKLILLMTAFFAAPVLLGVILTASTVSEFMVHKEPAQINLIPPSPQKQNHLPVVWIVTSNSASEVSELLTSYGVLAQSRAFQVYTVAPERRLSATTGELAVLPDFTFAEAPPPDLLVIPAAVDPTQEALISGVQLGLKTARLVLSLGEGARILAHATSTSGRKLSTHFISLPALEKEFPQTHWQSQSDITIDQSWISSGGLYSSLLAENLAAKKLAGEPIVESKNWESNNWESKNWVPLPTPFEYLSLLLHAAFDWEKPNVAIWVYPGVSEVGLAGFLDILPRTFSHHVSTIYSERKIFKTQNGLSVAPTQAFAELSHVDDFIIPAGLMTPLPDLMVSQLTSWGAVVTDASKTPPDQSFPKALRLILTERSDLAPLVAKMVRYGEGFGEENAERLSFIRSNPLWIRPILVGLLASLVIFFLLRRRNPSV